MSRHAVEWRAPTPLWAGLRLDETERACRPALVSVEGARFVERITAALVHDRPEVALAALEPQEALSKASPPRFLLVLGSLVCLLGGLPDHRVRPGDGLGLALRRLERDSQAWTGLGASGEGWIPVDEDGETERESSPSTISIAEELFPLFPIPVPDGAARRIVHAGLVPLLRAEVQQVVAQTDRWCARLVYRRACPPFAADMYFSAPSAPFVISRDPRRDP